jgi:hypothetical protein
VVLKNYRTKFSIIRQVVVNKKMMCKKYYCSDFIISAVNDLTIFKTKNDFEFISSSIPVVKFRCDTENFLTTKFGNAAEENSLLFFQTQLSDLSTFIDHRAPKKYAL